MLSETTDLMVDYANNSWDAINKIKNNKYSIIMVDIQLPDKSRYDIMHYVRFGSGENKKTPIIAVIGDSSAQQNIKVENSGFSGHITKPIKLEQLLNIIHKTLVLSTKQIN